MINAKLSRPVFYIKLQYSPKKGSSQKTLKGTIERLTLSKNLVLAHVHAIINEDIKILYDSTANKSMRKYKKFVYFNATKLVLPNKQAEPFKNITTPDVYIIHDTLSLQNSILKLIRNL